MLLMGDGEAQMNRTLSSLVVLALLGCAHTGSTIAYGLNNSDMQGVRVKQTKNDNYSVGVDVLYGSGETTYRSIDTQVGTIEDSLKQHRLHVMPFAEYGFQLPPLHLNFGIGYGVDSYVDERGLKFRHEDVGAVPFIVLDSRFSGHLGLEFNLGRFYVEHGARVFSDGEKQVLLFGGYKL